MSAAHRFGVRVNPCDLYPCRYSVFGGTHLFWGYPNFFGFKEWHDSFSILKLLEDFLIMTNPSRLFNTAFGLNEDALVKVSSKSHNMGVFFRRPPTLLFSSWCSLKPTKEGTLKKKQ